MPHHPLLLPCVERESPPLPQSLGKWGKDSGQAETWDTGPNAASLVTRPH